MDAPTPPDPDAPLLERLERLYPAVISDELDRIGLRHQVMRPDIRPLFPGARVVGRAFTLLRVRGKPGAERERNCQCEDQPPRLLRDITEHGVCSSSLSGH